MHVDLVLAWATLFGLHSRVVRSLGSRGLSASLKLVPLHKESTVGALFRGILFFARDWSVSCDVQIHVGSRFGLEGGKVLLRSRLPYS